MQVVQQHNTQSNKGLQLSKQGGSRPPHGTVREQLDAYGLSSHSGALHDKGGN